MKKFLTIREMPKIETTKDVIAQVGYLRNKLREHAEPSKADLEIIKRITEAGKIMGIDVLDHIIITKTKIFSFKERKLI